MSLAVEKQASEDKGLYILPGVIKAKRIKVRWIFM
jgi:hypothetical protein